MDFFTATARGSDALAAVSSPTQLPAPTTSNHDSTTTDAFAEAINARYSRKGSTVLIPLSPASEHPSASPPNSSIAVPTHKLQAPAMGSASSSSSEEFIAVNPTSVRDVLEGALVIDIRSHNAYALARLPHALSLSVPSTLLKRPLFSLDKLAQMLSSVPARERFSRWPEAPSILVYDADSGVLNEGGNLVGLLRKFRKEGYTRKLYWLKGGFKAMWREVLDVVDQNPMVEEDDVPAVAAPTPSGTLLPKHLPMRAFTMASTTTSRQVPLTPAVSQGSVDPFSLRLPQTTRTSHPSMSLPLPSTPAASTSLSFSRPSSLSLHLPPASKPTTIPEGKTLHLFPPAQRSAVDVSSLPTGGQSAAYNVVPRPHYKSMPGGHSMAFNPFFDNIRQNIELSGGRGSGEGIPLKLPRRVRRRVEELPFEWLREIGRRSGTVVDEAEESSDMDVIIETETKGIAHNATSSVNISRSIVAGTKKSKKRRRKTKQSSNLTRLHPSSSSSSSSSESNSPPPDSSELSYSASPSKSNSKAGSASPPPGLASISLNPLATQPPAATSSPQVTTTDPSEGESSGDDLAKALAMQFYKIELGEQRRLMGVMEHHSKESTTFSTSAQSTAPSSSSGALPGGYAGVRVLPGLKCGMPIGNSTSSSGSSSNATVQPRSVTTSTFSVSQASTSKSEEGAAQIAFPYSITAGVEKGEKNRYRNIWPFEHARVRLQKSCPEDDDYMNASYVQPLGTNKRYIATQGPLPATFTDFWTLCWQENVHVIVMLTREVESALIKCGNYWNEGDYGSLQLKLISTTDSPEREKRRKERESSSGFFNFPQVPEVQRPGEQHEDHTIRRVFQLTNKKYPQAKPRIVTQLQYLDWPDLDVPKDPKGLLELMKEVDEIVENTRVEGGMQWGEGPWSKSPIGTPPKEQRPPSVETLGGRGDVDPATGVATHAVGRAPVLLHCSAGVGRTGGFIAVDAVLDGVRREMRKRRQQQQQYQVKSDVSSVTSSQSQSPSSLPGEDHPERMDVDRGPFDKAVDTGLTMPMDVGGNEVHVPIAGLRNGQGPMDVDSVNAHTKKDSQLKASPALLKEVKTGHAKAIAALADNNRHSSSTPDNHGETAQAESPQRDVGPSDSSSGASSTPRSTSLSTRSVMSSNHTSTTSLTQAVKAVDPTLGSSDSSSSLQQDKSTVRVASSSTSQAGPAMDSWRTVGPRWERDVALASPRGMAFDYVEPRRLHDNRSPPLLSSYDEPIRRVIEDMREQRMSLCQSLRQYVFVHRAIIEGVLKIMDEEKNRKRGTVEDVEMAVADTDRSVRPPSMPSVFGKPAAASKSSDMLVSPMPLRPPGLDRTENIGLGPALVLDEHGARRTPLSQESPLLEVLVPTGSPMSPRTKRQASPTELVSEDSQGAPRLTKRASVKRRPVTPRVSKEEDSGVQLGSLMLSSPPPA